MTLATWAYEQFGHADLGDARRARRLVRIAMRAAERPGGKISEVFTDAAERQAAYDALEHDAFSADGVREALFGATARACADVERALVVVDGTSLTLTDRAGTKGFGRIGPYSANAKGLKVLNALALDERGVPLGVAEQAWWARRAPAKSKGYRKASERESVHWRRVVETVSQRFAQLAPETTLHFIGDREADASLLILKLVELNHEFTIRSNAMRKVVNHGRRQDMRGAMQRLPVIAKRDVELPATKRRPARTASLDIRAASLEVSLRDHHTKTTRIESLTVVWARERGRAPKTGRLDWVLFTNVAVSTAADARAVLDRYTKRWRVEEFHKTWKSGTCSVEDTQLRSANAVIKWATVLAAVATRADQLRLQARVEPDAPAETVLSSTEIEALVLLKHRIKKRTESVTADGLTVKQAVRWIADLGGYVGSKSSGAPGAITIRRGLDRLEPAVELLEALRAKKKR